MARQLSSDEEANLKRQLRRRLIGAVALTTAAVIILPMVLDREPAPAAQDIELRIPDKDHAGEFTPQVAMDAASAVAPQSAPAAATTIAPLLDKPAAAPTAKPQASATPAKPEPKQPTPAKPAAKPAEKPAAVPQSGFAVQVGAFSNADSAKHLKDQLSKQGYHAYTEKSGGKIRVRVGGYPSREAADKVRRKLEAKGMHPNVVSLN